MLHAKRECFELDVLRRFSGTMRFCQNGRNPDKAANTSYFSRKGIHLVQATTNWWGMSTILGAFLALKWGTQFIFWPKK